MLLLIHITLALLGLMQAFRTLFKPTRPRLSASYALLAGTLVSGAALVCIRHAALSSACTSGVVYAVVILGCSAVGRYRLRGQALPSSHS